MRDYSNMPVAEWAGKPTLLHAEAQISHAEPVILVMGDDFDVSLDADNCGGRLDEATGIVVDCKPEALALLGERNNIPEFADLARIATTAAQVVDLDPARRRIVIHD